MNDVIPEQRTESACPTPKKARFATMSAAEDAARRAGFELQKTLYPYDECPCGWVHLTSKKSSRLTPDTTVFAGGKELNSVQFAVLVRQEVIDRASAEDAAELRKPENLIRWSDALKDFQQDIAAQLAAKSGVKNEKTVAWRARIMRVQRSLSDRKVEVKRLLHAYYSTPDALLTQEEQEYASRKLRRRDAGERAVDRLKSAHPEEFIKYLAEEFAAEGLPVPRSWAQDDTEGEEENGD